MDTPSGASVIINMAPFLDAMDLKNAVAKELSQSNMSFDLKSMGLDQDVDAGAFLKTFFLVDSSKPVQDALWKCLGRCLYNGEKITPATFEPEEARQDFYPIVAECLAVNLRDFFKPLVSKFFVLFTKLAANFPPSK